VKEPRWSPGFAARAKLSLPPYSPDLNPIEQAFAKLKTLLRITAHRPRRRTAGRTKSPNSIMLYFL
jgi:transposase